MAPAVFSLLKPGQAPVPWRAHVVAGLEGRALAGREGDGALEAAGFLVHLDVFRLLSADLDLIIAGNGEALVDADLVGDLHAIDEFGSEVAAVEPVLFKHPLVAGRAVEKAPFHLDGRVLAEAEGEGFSGLERAELGLAGEGAVDG
jgi:hypothetical protein